MDHATAMAAGPNNEDDLVRYPFAIKYVKATGKGNEDEQKDWQHRMSILWFFVTKKGHFIGVHFYRLTTNHWEA